MALKENIAQLTDTEIKEIEELGPYYNRVKEEKNPLLVAGYRTSLSYNTAKLILTMVAVLNILSITCIVCAGVIYYLRPAPDYYASTPSGKLYGPLPKVDIEAYRK